MYDYSIELALFDIIPVLLSIIGLIFVAKTIEILQPSLKRLAYLSIICIIIGGVSKVTWKILIAGFDLNIMFLNNNLFIFMAPGFTLLSYTIWAARRSLASKAVSARAWLFPVAIIVFSFVISAYLAISFPSKRLWFISLLVLLTISNTVFIWHAARHSWQVNAKLSSLCFVLNLVGIFALSAYAKAGDQNEAAQWIAEIINTFTQGSFLIGAWILLKTTRLNQDSKQSLIR